MTREHAKQFLPIMQAYAEGKEIEYQSETGWSSIAIPGFRDDPSKYRVKPEPKHAPFTVGDAVMFMGKSIIEKGNKLHVGIVTSCDNMGVVITLDTGYIGYGWGLENLQFLDGSPFGKPINE